jgi:uncharacterized protein
LENFTPLSAFSGGLLIGLSATILLLVNGRIAGISGMLGGLLPPQPRAEVFWRLAFIAGIILGAFGLHFFQPGLFQTRQGFPPGLLIAGGFLVGFGTRMGNGCTSGHAICGIARFSLRSIAATLTFMATGFLTVFLVRHVFA